MLQYRIHHTQPQALTYSRGLKLLQVIYENFDYDLTHGFFIHVFNKYLFYDDKFLCNKNLYHEKLFIEIMNKKSVCLITVKNLCHHRKKNFIEIINKKIRVFNHSQKFMSS